MRVVKDSLGRYIGVKDDGSRVPLSPSQVSNATTLPKQSVEEQRNPLDTAASPVPQPAEQPIVRNVQGVSLAERTLVKNWASDPAKAREVLEGMGYDVMPWGNHVAKMQFAVRPRGKSGVWKVLDPDGFDWQDLLDFGGDMLSGAYTTIAAMLAAPAAAAAGVPTGGAGALAVESAAVGAGSAAGEFARESVGEMSGLTNNIKAGNVKTAGVIGAAAPVVTKLAAPVLRPVGRALAYGFERSGAEIRYAAARIVGAKIPPGMSRQEVIDALMNPAGKKIVPLGEQAKALYNVMMNPKGGLLNETWPEVQRVNAMLAHAKEANAVMDFMPVIDNLEKMAKAEGAGMVERRALGRSGALDDAFRAVRENPAFTPDEAMLAQNPELRAAVEARDAEFMGDFRQRALTTTDLPRKNEALKKWEAISKRGAETAAEGGAATEESPGLKEFESRFRQGFGGKAFSSETVPGSPSAAKRQAIAGFEKEFGEPGAFGAPESSTAKFPSGVLRGVRGEGPGTREAADAEFRAPGARKQVLELINYLVGQVQRAGVPLSEVPLDLAHFLKRNVQDVARRGAKYAGAEVDEPFARVARDAAAAIRNGVVENMPAEVQSDFADAMSAFERKVKLRNAIVGSFQSPADVESFLREIHGKSNASAAIYAAGLEKEFGIRLLPDVEAARVAEIAQGGVGEFVRRHPFAAGAAVFHPATGLPVLGGLAAAPEVGKGLQAAGRAIRAGSEVAARTAERLASSPESNAAAVRLIQDAAVKSGKGIASENQASVSARRRRRVTKLF